jgi:hypothetical protein
MSRGQTDGQCLCNTDVHQCSTGGEEEGHDVLLGVNIIQPGKALNDEMKTSHQVLETKCELKVSKPLQRSHRRLDP